MEKFGCIYVITNTVNGKLYVGQTTAKKLRERWQQHKDASKREDIMSLLYRAIRKYGADNFKIEEIATAYSREELDTLEQHYIQELNTLAPVGYNCTTGGFSFNHTDETKKVLSKKLTEYYSEHEGPWTGRHHTEETKERMSEAKKGKILTEEEVEVRRRGLQAFYDNLRETDPEAYEAYIAPRREQGKKNFHGSEEVEKKAAEGRIRNHVHSYSKERNAKISETLKKEGHAPSALCHERARLAKLGKKRSPETLALISSKLKGRKAPNRIYLTEEQRRLFLEARKENKTMKDIIIAVFGEYSKKGYVIIKRELAESNDYVLN